MSSESPAYKQPCNTTFQPSLSSIREKENDVENQDGITEDVLNVREAARLLRVHHDKLTDLARRGLIPAGVVGSRWRFSRVALLVHLSQPRQGTIKPTRKLADYPPPS